ncbi:unnamed protein product [Rotaria sp. Silwood2]|nr:unnamed protein product [Rotaria sp. Silwood2]
MYITTHLILILALLTSVVQCPGGGGGRKGGGGSRESRITLIKPGVVLPIATCLRDSIRITNKYLWLFNIASEPGTTTESSTTTLLNRTVSVQLQLLSS